MTKKFYSIVAAVLLAASCSGCAKKVLNPSEVILQTAETTIVEEETTQPATQEHTVPATTVPETTAPKETDPKTTIPKETVPKSTVPETTVPTIPAFQKDTSKSTISKATSPTDSTVHIHTWGNWTVTKNATETSTGNKIRNCTVCKESQEESIPVLSHNHSYAVRKISPTCTSDGYTLHTCSCGKSYQDAFVKATGHSWGSWLTTKEPTETATGLNTRTCAVCKQVEKQTIQKLEHTHKYVETVVAPTCASTGYTEHTCSCGASYKDNQKPAVGHSWSEWETTILPTSESEGTAKRTCSVCQKAEQKRIEKLPQHKHSYQEKITVRPTCTTVGEKTFICSCGDKYTENIAKAQHTYKITTVSSTCTAQGYTLHRCSVCGSSYKDSFTAQTDHNYEAKVIAPTCTAQGYTTYTCKACGFSKKENLVSATGHSWGDWVTTKAPTESAAGIQARNCRVCGAEDTRETDKLAHTHSYVSSITQPPACTEVGLRFYLCSCGDSYSETIPATGHSWSSWETTEEPTLSSYGKAWRKCAVCNQTESKVLDKIQHTHNYTEERVEPTCTSDGYILRTCSCGDSYKQILEGGHNWTLVQPVYRVREYAVCPHCNVYLCELDGSADPVEALRAHCDASGGDWYNHSWANKAESILVTPAKWQCTVCGAEKPWEN